MLFEMNNLYARELSLVLIDQWPFTHIHPFDKVVSPTVFENR